MPHGIPAHLDALDLTALAVDYPFDNAVFDRFWNADERSGSSMAGAIKLINARAAYALAMACSEWVVARVEREVDTLDALLRIEAGWAALADWRYADLPSPMPIPPGDPKEYARPLRLAMRLMSRAHELCRQTSPEVNSKALGLAMLADHVVGRHPAFEPWLWTSLRRCHKHCREIGTPMADQPLVAREFFDPDFVWRDGAADESLARYVRTLELCENPYLRTPAQMRADGFQGPPYGRTSFEG